MMIFDGFTSAVMRYSMGPGAGIISNAFNDVFLDPGHAGLSNSLNHEINIA